MSLTVVNSKGIQIQMGNGASPEVFTKIGGVNAMPSIPVTKSTIERTSIDDDTRYFGVGIQDAPQISLEVFWNPDDTQQNALITAYGAESENNYKIVCPDSPATNYAFTAIVVGYTTPTGGINEDLKATFTFQLVENAGGDIVTKS